MNVIPQEFDEAIDLSAIQEHPENPRRGDDDAVRQSVGVNGFFGAILVHRATGNVIAGNTRYRVLKGEGAETVPGFWIDCDDETARRILLADNRTSDLAFYDDEELFALLNSIVDDNGMDGLEGTGYDRAAYELLLQGLEADNVVGGIRQGGTPGERLDAYNLLDIRSIILPYASEVYDEVAGGLVALRQAWRVESNADAVRRLVTEAVVLLELAEAEG